MDKIAINNGGHPYTGDDPLFVQDSVLEALQGSLSWLLGLTADDMCILSGCAINLAGGNYTYTSGFIWFNGEIYYIPAQPNPQPYVVGVDFNIETVQTNLPSGIETYEDLSVNNTWLQRRAFITQAPVGTQITIGMRYADCLATALLTTNVFFQKDVVTGTWNSVGAAGQPALQTGWSTPLAGQGVKFKKNAAGQVTISGYVRSVAGGSSTIFTLPAGYEPQFAQPNAILGNGYKINPGGGNVFYPMFVLPNGNVLLFDSLTITPPPANEDYYFHIQYQL